MNGQDSNKIILVAYSADAGIGVKRIFLRATYDMGWEEFPATFSHIEIKLMEQKIKEKRTEAGLDTFSPIEIINIMRLRG